MFVVQCVRQSSKETRCVNERRSLVRIREEKPESDPLRYRYPSKLRLLAKVKLPCTVHCTNNDNFGESGRCKKICYAEVEMADAQKSI